MRDRVDVLVQKRLSMPISRVIFSDTGTVLAPQQANWLGLALYRLTGGPILPDLVHREVRIHDEQIERRRTSSGILFESPEGQKVVGRLDGEYLELSYSLPKSGWSRSSAWRWAEAAREAFSILLGQTVRLLRREIWRGSRKYTEVRKQIGVDSLRPFAPMGHNSIVDPERFMTLSNFLARNEHGAGVCRKMFGQMATVTEQRTWQARELLLSTILEAALRTLEEHPFREGDYSFNRRDAMERFREDYLSPTWTGACERALTTYDRLRHRNSHPDWLYEETGTLSEDRRNQAYNDMVFLSQFYGYYMMLALAGVQGLNPEFPG